jgi:transposase
MDPEERRRAEWRRISKQEEVRKKNIDGLRKIMLEKESDSRKTPKSLLRLILYGGGVTSDEASTMLGVKREVIDGWVMGLANKKLIIIESVSHPNPKLQPSPKLLKKLESYREKQKTMDLRRAWYESKNELKKKKQELIQEHESRIKLEEDLEKLRLVLSDKEKELQGEQEKRIRLENQITAMEEEAEGEFDERLRMLKNQLNRERNERMKIEALLKQEHDKLREEEGEHEKAYKKREKELREREAEIIEREKTLEEYEELEILFGEDFVEDERIASALEAITGIREKLDKSRKRLTEIDEKLRAEFEDISSEEEDVVRVLGEEVSLLKKRRTELESMLKRGGQPPTPAAGKPPAKPPKPEGKPPTGKPPAGPPQPPAGKRPAKTPTPPAGKTPTPPEGKPPTAKTPAKPPTPPAGPPAGKPPAGPPPTGKPPAKTPTPPAGKPPAKPPTPAEGKVEAPKVVSMKEMRKVLLEAEEEPEVEAPTPATKREQAHEIPLPPETEEKMRDESMRVGVDDMRKIFVDKEEAEEEEGAIGVDMISFLELLDKTRKTKIKDAAKELGVGEKTVNKWAEKLKRKKIVRTKKHVFGDMEVELMPEINVNEIMESYEAEKIKDEIKKLHKK